MSFTLRELEAEFSKVVVVTTDEIEQEQADCIGLYVWRNSHGEKYKWGPTPRSLEFHCVDTAADAHQIMFLCPACYAKNASAVGTHRVFVTFADRDVPEGAGSCNSEGQPSRWTVVSGNTLDDLVLTPSILLDAGRPADKGCHWHGFVGSNGIAPGHAG